MKALPPGLSPEAFVKAYQNSVAERYESDGQGGWRCRACKGPVHQTTCYASIHAAEFGDAHAGMGEVKQIPLPYCQKCEGEPGGGIIRTCIHVPLGQECGQVPALIG